MNFDYSKFKGLEDALGHSFSDPSLLFTALTHSSFSNEMHQRGITAECNERMEFLGDSVLSLAVSRLIFAKFPEMPEGELSRIRAGAVCEHALAGFARTIGLGGYLLLGKGEEHTNGRERPSILADAFEAVLAALYLDSDFETVCGFLLPFVKEEISQMLSSGHTEDYKTMLQQVIQQDPAEKLEYVLVEESGPAHCRSFTVEARIGSNVLGKGTGRSKREAEQSAAREALELLGIEKEKSE